MNRTVLKEAIVAIDTISPGKGRATIPAREAPTLKVRAMTSKDASRVLRCAGTPVATNTIARLLHRANKSIRLVITIDQLTTKLIICNREVAG